MNTVLRNVLLKAPSAGIPQNGLVAMYAPIRQRNLLKWSEDFSNAVWTLANGATLGSVVLAPNNTLTARTLNFAAQSTSIIRQTSIKPTISTTFTVSVFARSSSGDGKFRLNISDLGIQDYFSSDITLTSEWQRFSWSATVSGTSLIGVSGQILNASDGVARSIEIWHPQIELSSSPTTYQKTTDNQTLWNERKTNVQVQNIVQNGDFANGTTGWIGITSIVDGRASKLATGQYQSIYQTVNTVNGNKYYFRADIDGTSENYYGWLGSGVTFPTTGLRTVSTIIAANASTMAVGCGDSRTSGWTTYYVDNVITIDLTALFGAGNEPTVQQCDDMFSTWFDGAVNMNLPVHLSNKQYLASNIVSNGNFASGTSGWSAFGGSQSATNNVLTITGDGTSAYSRTQETINTITNNKKYYCRFKGRVTNANCLYFGIGIEGGTSGGNALWVYQNSPSVNTWYAVSGIYTPTNLVGNTYFRLRQDYIDAATANGKVMEVQEIFAVDLTSLFGAGNEPTQAQCDQIFATWLDGTSPVTWKQTVGGGTLGSTTGSDTNDPVFDGQGLSFGGDDYVKIPHSANLPNQKFAIELVLKGSNLGALEGLFNKSSTTGGSVGYGLTFRTTQPYLRVWVYDASFLKANNANIADPRDGTVKHIIAQGDGTKLQIYINNVLVAEEIVSYSNVSNTEHIYLASQYGAGAPTAFFNGNIYYHNLYNRILTPAEISRNYQALRQECAKWGVTI